MEEIKMNEIKIEHKKNIYEKLSAITTELMTIAKNLEVGVGQSKYKAVGEADVLRAVKPLEAKYGVYSFPYSREIIESGTIESNGYNGQVKKNLYERIKVVYRFINVEEPKEYIDITSYGDGIDSQDKSVGKAMTYADKYALMKAYKITTGEDPDQNQSEELKGVANAPLDKLLCEKCNDLKIDLSKLAAYLKKSANTLTNEDLKNAISIKEKALGGKQC